MTLLGEMFPADPVGIGMMLEPLGLAAGPVVPTREWRELYAALDCAAVAAIHPFYTASIREFEAAGRKVVGSAPVGHDGTAAWLEAIGDACGVARDKIDAAKNRFLPAIKAALAPDADQGPHHAVGLRRLRAAGRAPAGRERRATCAMSAPPARARRGPSPIANGSRRKGVQVQYRASLEQDLAAIDEFKPDLAIGTTPVVQKAKETRDPGALLHQPDLGAAADGPRRRGLAGAGRSTPRIANKARFDEMKDVLRRRRRGPRRRRLGRHAAGPPEFREKYKRQLASPAKKRKAEEMI